jgi:hypothetical protein
MYKPSRRLRMLVVGFAVAMLAFLGPHIKSYSGQRSGASLLDEIARNIAKDVAAVGKTSASGSGAPVLILEETHTSRASLIQHAIVLTRLYARYGLRDVALEGYLQDKPKIDARWFTDRLRLRPVDRARVAVRLLKEGEISAAEFSKLVYADINLVPAEVSSQHNVSLGDGAYDAVLALAQKISPSRGDAVSKKLEAAVKDPLSAEEQLNMAESLDRDRASMKIVLPPKTLRDWQSWLAFWRARAGGNKTMLEATLSASSGSASRMIAMNVGAAHTEGLCGMLRNANRPYAVITPLALKNHDVRGDIDHNYPRKEKRLSVQTDGFFMSAIQGATTKSIKPEPDVNEPWLQAKALIYQLTDVIANRLVGQPSPPSGGKPAFDFSEDDLRGRWVRVDPTQIEIVPDDLNGKRKAVLFPLVLNPGDSTHTRTLWIKAIADQQVHLSSAAEETALIESMLRQALSEVQAEKDAPSQAEDSSGTIRVSSNVRAAIGGSKQAVMAKTLRSAS